MVSSTYILLNFIMNYVNAITTYIEMSDFLVHGILIVLLHTIILTMATKQN
jgi:hypothetical protein